jgi:hypothetical protein
MVSEDNGAFIRNIAEVPGVNFPITSVARYRSPW